MDAMDRMIETGAVISTVVCYFLVIITLLTVLTISLLKDRDEKHYLLGWQLEDSVWLGFIVASISLLVICCYNLSQWPF